MTRLVAVVLGLAVGLPAAALAADHPSRPYSTKQVLSAFAKQGITLQRQHVRPSAPWTRFATGGSLHVLVFRSERDTTRTIAVDLGKRPNRKPHAGAIVIHLRAPRGSGKPGVQETSYDNLAVVYLKGSGYGPHVNAALHSLHHS